MSIWTIGAAQNYGTSLTATWKRPWGGKPAGFTVTGRLKASFVVNGRTLIGELEVTRPDGSHRVIAAPWSKNWLSLEVR